MSINNNPSNYDNIQHPPSASSTYGGSKQTNPSDEAAIAGKVGATENVQGSNDNLKNANPLLRGVMILAELLGTVNNTMQVLTTSILQPDLRLDNFWANQLADIKYVVVPADNSSAAANATLENNNMNALAGVINIRIKNQQSMEQQDITGASGANSSSQELASMIQSMVQTFQTIYTSINQISGR
jgi:hypothetical protein